MRRLVALTAVAACLATPAFAQRAPDPNEQPHMVATAPLGVATTSIAFTGGTAGTYTAALASNAARRDCTIYSANAFSVSPGGSPSAATAIPVAAGGTFKCSSVGGTVMSDQINVASATAANTYVVWSQ